MTISLLPCGGGGVDELTDITYRIKLENKDYDVRFRYLQRESNIASGDKIIADEWYLYLGLSGRTPFLKTALRTNRDLLRQVRYNPDCPTGDLILRDYIADSSDSTGGQYNPERVNFSDLGKDKRFRLVYWSAL
jgi:hypothetical protein